MAKQPEMAETSVEKQVLHLHQHLLGPRDLCSAKETSWSPAWQTTGRLGVLVSGTGFSCDSLGSTETLAVWLLATTSRQSSGLDTLRKSAKLTKSSFWPCKVQLRVFMTTLPQIYHASQAPQGRP